MKRKQTIPRPETIIWILQSVVHVELEPTTWWCRKRPTPFAQTHIFRNQTISYITVISWKFIKRGKRKKYMYYEIPIVGQVRASIVR